MTSEPGSTLADKAGARTPLMRQYVAAKLEHPDAFLFFRLGDFYEMFFDDAVRGAQLLGLTLTSRNKQDPEPVPMCGIPWHQRDGYVGRLLRQGYKVAICDQLEDPAQAKGLGLLSPQQKSLAPAVNRTTSANASRRQFLGIVASRNRYPNCARQRRAVQAVAKS